MDRLAPEDIRFAVSQNVSNQYNFSEDPRFLSKVHYDVLHKLADGITHHHLKVDKHPYHTTYSMEVYVASPEVFWQIVQEEAMRISRQMNFGKIMEERNSGTN